jgi:nitrate/nitrite transporter NarK
LDEIQYPHKISLGAPVYLLCLYFLLLYSAVLPINNFSSDILQVRFGLTDVEAGRAFGYIYAVSGLVLILVGLFADRYGKLGHL